MEDLATIQQVTAAWRALTPTETTRAEYYLSAVSRRIRRLYRDVDQHIASGDLDQDDVSDVVVELVLDKLGAGPTRNSRSWSQTTGPFAQQVTLRGDTADGDYTLLPWMIEVFEGRVTAAHPAGSFPPSGHYESLGIWKENVR
ncbi:Gp19/Gp15/Gp42 family protein [Arthrobacter sp. NPDC090010]|uniref:Gp19/Gp15/Gp42 family protein n=1 Tax=Arthrobacter sp. NPDC090010 TaxID=3363942 RepID=UPI0037FCFDF5